MTAGKNLVSVTVSLVKLEPGSPEMTMSITFRHFTAQVVEDIAVMCPVNS